MDSSTLLVLSLLISIVKPNAFSSNQQHLFHDSSESINGTIPISLDFRLYFLREINELDLTMTIKGTLTVRWLDHDAWAFAAKLRPNRAKYDKSLSVPAGMMWKPFIVVFNSADDYENAVDRNGEANPLDVSNDGTVQWWATGYWKLSCEFRYEKFPFDTQHCRMKLMNFLSASYYETIKWTFSIPKPEDLIAPTMLWEYAGSNYSNTNWTWDNNGVVDYSSLVRFDIWFKRKWFPHYFYAMFTPLICLTLLQLSTFALPSGSVDRPIYSITVLLAFAIMRAEIHQLIPKTVENILIIILINLSIIGSSAVTFYCAIFIGFLNAKKSHFFNRHHWKIDRFLTFMFVFFYIFLYCVVLVKMIYE